MSNENNELLKKKKRQALLKKKKEQELNSSKKFLSDKERKELASNLRKNAIATFAQFDFYKDGYKKTMGILIFNILAFVVALSAFTYSAFIYKAPPSFLGVNSNKQLMIESPLTELVYTDSEIINFAALAYIDINSYNFVNLKSNYFSGLKDYYTEKTLKNYKDEFMSTKEMLFVQENAFIVSSTVFKGVRIDKEASDALSSQVGKRVWVIKIKSEKVYQNHKGFVTKRYDTTMKVMRVRNEENERGIAIQSFVDKEIR